MTEIPDSPVPENPGSMRANYQGNTNKERGGKKASREERKIVDKVITGKVIERKKPLGQKIKDTFIGENMHNVGRFVLFDVLVPAAKSMIVDAMSKGTERAFYGETRRNNTSGSRSNYTPYNQMSPTSRRPEQRRDISYRARATHDFNEIVLETRGEAEEVIDQLNNLLDDYQVVTVSELYDTVGITGDFTDDKWGWTDLRTAHITRVREGYLLNMPRTEPVN